MADQFAKIFHEIEQDPANVDFTRQKIAPLYYAGSDARINIIAQAPGRKAQEQRMFWNDRSGQRLRKWLGVSWNEFYHSGKIAIMPMDFYFPGNGPHGDLPPRPHFAEKWHPRLLALMPNIQLTILIGSYAIHTYLDIPKSQPITTIVKNYRTYLPQYYPIIHPSPRNQIWMAKNPWFADELLTDLRQRVRKIMEAKL